MNLTSLIKKSAVISILSALALTTSAVKATIVEMETSLGTFRVNLFDRATPQTVANFLDYLNAGEYTNSIIHRNETNFVVQGGGFVFNGTLPLTTVNTTDPVINEPVFSNVRGTIAMAKIGGEPNSATSQWFINLTDSSANLDAQNGGFTVFGQVIDDGMTVLDDINALSKFNFGGSLGSIPLRNYTVDDFNSQINPGANNFIVISRITVVDSDIDSAADLNPAENTLVDTLPPTDAPALSRRAGSFPIILMMLMGLLGFSRIRHN